VFVILDFLCFDERALNCCDVILVLFSQVRDRLIEVEHCFKLAVRRRPCGQMGSCLKGFVSSFLFENVPLDLILEKGLKR